MVELQLVELVARVRFSLAAQDTKMSVLTTGIFVIFVLFRRENRTREGGRGNSSFPVEEGRAICLRRQEPVGKPRVSEE